MNVIIFGPPGAGKGTQAQNIVNKFKLHQFSTGDLLRNEIKKKSDIGKEIEQQIIKGDFASDNEQLARLDQALTEFRRRGLVVYPIGVGSRTGVNLDIVLQDYVRGIDFDASLESDLEGLRTRLNTEGLNMLEKRLGGRSFVLDSPGLSSSTFLQSVVDSHRSISFQLIPSEDTQEIWQWIVMAAVMLFVVAILFY